MILRGGLWLHSEERGKDREQSVGAFLVWGRGILGFRKSKVTALESSECPLAKLAD